jgi:hypothetical protein
MVVSKTIIKTFNNFNQTILLGDIKDILTDRPTYGYRRVTAMLR